MKGAPASRASRREISVLPTPVGPIIRMFFGSTSSRSFSSSLSRRQRLRSAIATARLASFWPMMKRSSSETISRGEKSVMALSGGPCGGRMQWRCRLPLPRASALQRLDGDVAVGVDADVGRDVERAAHDRLGVERPVDQRAGGGERVVAAGANAHGAGLGLEHV